MTTAEKRADLQKICLSVSADDCCTEACPIGEFCAHIKSAEFVPGDDEFPDSDVELVYNEYVKRKPKDRGDH